MTAGLLAWVALVITWMISLTLLWFTLGAVLGYVAYVMTHEALHERTYSRWPFAQLQRLHDEHHTGWHTNYGVTTPLWDIVFGTITHKRKV
jgi:4-hydroxysphinganine ceramide fatty acyl 2-hydroxylase